jgi:hypothetical protein
MGYRLFIDGKRTEEAGEYTIEKIPWAGKKHYSLPLLTQDQRARKVFLAAYLIDACGDVSLCELIRED